MENIPHQPKILYLDIETSPMVIESWGIYEVNALRLLEDFKIMAFCAIWEGGKTISRTLADYQGYKKGKLDDKKLIKELHSILSEAEIVIAHNGISFDLKRCNARFAFYGLSPIPPYRVIDTCLVARRCFGFTSNKLNDLLVYFGFKPKVDTGGYSLWVSCKQGDMKAWRHMKKYNTYDVVGLRNVYMKLRPWIQNHPNLGLYQDRTSCPNCGSEKLRKRGIRYTNSTRLQRYKCLDCKAWSSGRSLGKTLQTVK